MNVILEVGYPLFFAQGRVWAFARMPRPSGFSIVPDQRLVCAATCRDGQCFFSGLSTPPQGADMWIGCRAFRQSDDGTELLVIPDPFPIRVSGALAAQAAHVAGVTRMIRAQYARRSHGELRMDGISYGGQIARDPVVWK